MSAHAWLGARGRARWASCPLTQLAFVRIVSNPAFSADALSPAAALDLLESNLRHSAHEFWPDDLPVEEAAVGEARGRLRGHRQLNDAYLLALAARRKGVLATFDAAIATLAGKELAGAVEVIGA